jgi:hypothetical protein
VPRSGVSIRVIGACPNQGKYCGHAMLKVTVRFGKAIDFTRFEGLAGNPVIERAATDEVMYELMGLSGQEYIDVTQPASRTLARAPVRPAKPR